MPAIERSALLPYSARYMYDIVNRVEAYPDFLPWCGGTEIRHEDESSMEASIQIRSSGLEQWFVTRNCMVAGESIDMQLVDGPFRKLHGRWSFRDIGNEGCKIELMLDFEFKAGIVGKLIAPAFNRIADTLVDSFCQRAHTLHGR